MNGIKELVYRWNVDNPMDRWWREKHGVSFNSPRHREISFLDQLFEWEEDKLYEELEAEAREEKYNPFKHNYLKKQEEKYATASNEDMINEWLNWEQNQTKDTDGRKKD